jgi:hypothetical protein
MRQDHQIGPPRPPGGGEDGNSLASGDSLLELLAKLFVRRGTEATDVRDRIYALLGLAADTARLGLEPDYSITDYSRILLVAARAMIHTGNLELLSISQFPKERELPSWVPDWRPELTSPYHLFAKHSSNLTFSASGQSRPTLTDTDDLAILGLAGCRIDTIEEVADPWMDKDWDLDRYPQHMHYLEQVRALCERSAEKGRPIYASEAGRNEALWRVPIADMQLIVDARWRATEGSAILHACNLEICRMCEEFDTAIAQNRTPPLSIDAFLKRKDELSAGYEYLSSMLRMGGKRPFRTREEYVGLGPVPTRLGDLVVVFSGAEIPHVIRPRGGDRFEFLGDAYCDGAMDGEVWDKTRLETFLLV